MDGSMKVDAFISAYSSYFPEKILPGLRDRLLELDEKRWFVMSAAKFKNPTTALVLSLFLGGLGIDRFYIGQNGLGIAKLLTGAGCVVWWFIDLFLIQKATKEENANLLSALL